ncbi:MAG: Ig-like domain-containing protein [Flavobacterium sp.]
MKKQILFKLIILFLFQYQAASSQVVFYEDFGSNPGRIPSPYVPTSGTDTEFYNFAAIQSDNNGENLNRNVINNGYYAVVRPGEIYSNLPPGVPPGYDWWVTNPGASPGAQSGLGAVLVVNGGSVLNQYYRRVTTLMPGKKYRLTAYVYASGQPNVSTQFEIQSAVSENVIGSSGPLPYGTPANRWVPFSWTFEVPSDPCVNLSPQGALVAVSLRNAYSALGGNDFYVDDILLEEVTIPTVDDNFVCDDFDLDCSSGSSSVNLNSLYTGTLPNGVELVWFTTPDHQAGTEVPDPTNVTVTGVYYAFFYDTSNDCYNTDASTSSVNVVILPTCSGSLEVTKSGTYFDVNGNGVTNVGDEIRYTFSVTNTGNTVLTNVTISDTNATVTGGPLASLGVGVTNSTAFTAVHVLTQADIDAGYVYNLATAIGQSPNGSPVSDTSVDPTPCATCPVDPGCPDCTITPVTSNCFENYIAGTSTIDAYWTMDGNSNDSLPLSGTNNATATGSGVSFSSDAFAGSNSVSFSGTGGIQYSDGTFMNDAFTNLSWGAWIKPTAVSGGGNRMIFDEGGTTNGIGIYLNNTGQIVFGIGKNGNAQSASYNFPTASGYHHVAFTYENGMFRMFIDGRLQGALNTGFATIPAHTDIGGIGAMFATSILQVAFPSATFVPFNGLIDDAFYSKSAISQGNLLQYGRCYNRNLFANVGCPSEAFMVQGDAGDYISINLFTGEYQGPTTDNYAPPTSQNAAGFNELDGLIYSVDANTGYVLVTELTPAGLGYTYNTYRVAYIPELDGNANTGDVYNGRMYVKLAGNNSTHYIIDVDPTSPTYLQLLNTVTSGTNTQVSDWAVNPQDGKLYTVGDNGTLYRYELNTGAVTNLGTSLPAGAYGGVFFDSDGYLYAYNNATEGVFRIDVDVSPIGLAFTDVTGIGSLGKNDGARCPSTSYQVDYGDLPDTGTPVAGNGTGANNYRTYLSDNGPRHQINASVPLTMGTAVTRESDGLPSANANTDADDGITSTTLLISGTQLCATVAVQNLGTVNATLYGWIDFDNNGSFDGDEFASITVPAGSAAGTNVQLCYDISSLPSLDGTNVYSRFRLTTQSLSNSNAATPSSEDTRSYGRALDGEVEDYRLLISAPAPSLAVTKNGVYFDTNGDGVTNAGDEIRYTFVVTNTGNTVLTNITITDNNATVTGGPLASLAVGASNSTTFTAVHVVTQADITAGYVYNLATATGQDPNGNPVTGTSTDPSPCTTCPADPGCPDCTITPVLIAPNPSIAVTKDGVLFDANNNGATNVGDEIHYTFVVINTGNTVLTNVTVTDNNATVSGGPLASLAVGASDSSTFTAVHVLTQADITAGYVYNLATAAAQDPNGNPVSGTSTDPTPCGCPVNPSCPSCTITPVAIPPAPSMTVTKDGVYFDANNNGITNVGDEIHYTFVVTNTGNTLLTNITVTDNNATVSGGPLASLAVGASDSTTFTAVHVLTQADINAGYVYNLATATGQDPNGNPISDTSADPTPCSTCPANPACPDCTIVELINTTHAIDDINNTFVNTPVSGNVLTNDFDLEGNTQGNVTLATPPSNGTVTMNPDGSYVYTPNTGFTGTDTFTYTVCDNGTPQACDTATLTINVGVPPAATGNNAVVANNDAVIAEAGSPVILPVLANDFDPNGNPFTITPGSVTNPSNGTVVLNPNGTVTYTPNSGFVGQDTFTYQICDNGTPATCDTATVIVTVLPNNNGANTTYAIDDSYFINCSSISSMNLLSNDYDLEGNQQNIVTTLVVQPLHGTVAINADGTFTYSVNGCYTGPDSFVYQVCDNGSPVACDKATVYLLIQDITPPVLVSQLAPILNVNCDAIPALPTLVFTDVCSATSNITVTSTEVTSNVSEDGKYTITRTFTASDLCNNQTTVTQTVNVTIPDYIRAITTEELCNVDIDLTIDLAAQINSQFPGMIMAGGTFTDVSGVGAALSGSVFKPLDLVDGDYIVRYENHDPTCPRIVDVTVPVRRDVCVVENCVSLVVHNAFTPNGDGINENFVIDNITNPCYEENTVEIYNRWGVLVFEVQNYNNNDHVFKGYSEGRVTIKKASALPSGTYFYVLKYKNIEGNYSSKSGWLYLNGTN